MLKKQAGKPKAAEKLPASIREKRFLIVDDIKTNRFVFSEYMKHWKCRFDTVENGPKAYILLAEDNPVNQKLANKLLEKMGYRVDTVNNGKEAITALEKTSYDLVLMDVQMPEMGGYEATRYIRAQNASVRNPSIPIIAMTAHTMPGDREKCLDCGMDDYVSKPINRNHLKETIEKQLRRKE